MQQEMTGWFTGRLPDGWFDGPPDIEADRDEILVIGRLPDVDLGADAGEEAAAAARVARIKRFREETRETRMRIADEAERIFGRKVAWGAECGGVRRVFTNMAIPVMTRLRMRERAVLDTLIDAGVARSRSEALAWCVRLVEKNESEWIDSLRDALAGVEAARARGPAA